MGRPPSRAQGQASSKQRRREGRKGTSVARTTARQRADGVVWRPAKPAGRLRAGVVVIIGPDGVT